MHRIMVRTAMVLAALLTTATPTACAQSADDPPTPAPAALAALRTIAGQPIELGVAEAHAIQRCLETKGFDAPLPRPVVGSIANLPLRVEEQHAARRGYGDTITRGADPTEDPLNRYARTLSPTRRDQFERAVDDLTATRVQFTTPGGWAVGAATLGCAAEARATVYGSVENWLIAYYLPQDLNDDAAKVYTHPSVSAAAVTYHECMTERGHPFRYPQDAVQHAQQASVVDQMTQPSHQEILIATADAQCQKVSGLLRTIHLVLEHDAREWIIQNRSLVRRAAIIVEQARGNARTILLGT
ncbi:MAG: hypothetical protein ACRDT0_27005 [Pseudonocardiaceae bacterium]